MNISDHHSVYKKSIYLIVYTIVNILKVVRVSLSFEWSRTKSHVNRKKHGIAFEEAAEVFDDFYALEYYDDTHSNMHEDRFCVIGSMYNGLIVFVVYKPVNINRVRIISARKASKEERRCYEKNIT